VPKRLRLGVSPWLGQYRGRGPAFPTLRGHHDVDVAIVGGGITGCACAYVLARSGVRVALLEARQIGRGSTAASTALLMQEPDVDLLDLGKRYGTDTARRMWQSSRRAVAEMVGTLQGLGVRASLEQRPSIYFARDGSELHALRRELKARHNAGMRGRWLSTAALKRVTGIDGAGAILTQGDAQVDPYRACLGLARAAQRAGAQLFARSHVKRTRSSSASVRLVLERGSITAGRVVIATGYATPEFKPLAGRFRMLSTYVIATARLPRKLRREMGLGDVMLWDTHRPYHYARWMPDGRLLFGGRDRPASTRPAHAAAIAPHASALSNELASLFPDLRGHRPEYAWEGLFATTPDGLPYIGPHRRYPRHLFALGYGGNGMTFGFLAAQILARMLAGKESPNDTLFGFSRR
jgi:glycine/D-amino acid oxidase-like deaminating enzyme